MSENNWYRWVAPGVAAVGGMYGAAKVFFSFVTRAELKEAIAEAEARTDVRHTENLNRFAKQDDELKNIRETVARIDERLKEG